jgi:probable phosphoglycerate mutase
MKKIYFVRHGESEGNAGPLRQSATTPLTEKGREQAIFIAKRVKKLPAEIIIASPMKRAEETAKFIAEGTGLITEFSDLFVERRRPSISLGKPKDDSEMLALEKILRESHLIPGFRHSDEENFDDLKERAQKALAYLAARPEEHILVVTHGFFMRILVALITMGDTLTAVECEQFIRTFHMENTGLSVFGYDEKEKSPWWLWVWNDHAHLG